MNRIIKFRCWINNEMWHDFWLSNDEHEGVLLYDDNLNNPPVKCNKPYILMQFTGLYDKNGKEVYEGDIIDGHLGYSPRVVTWMPEGRYTGWFATDETKEGVIKHLPIAKDNDFEVIGNRYENPELLEVTDTNGNP